MGRKGIDQETPISSPVSNKYGKTIIDPIPKASQPASQSVNRIAGDAPIVSQPDPTRFGDWEHAGRCIDF